MASNDATSSLSDDDVLSLSIGRVVRAHSRVEYALRNIREALDPGTPTKGFAGAEQLATECRARLELAALTNDVAIPGQRSLESARVSNALRNSIVHNLWLLESESSGEQMASWHAIGATRGSAGNSIRPSAYDISSVDGVQRALKRSAVRLSGLFMALHEVLPRYADSTSRAGWTSNMARYIALMNDQFEMDEAGDWVLTL